MSMAHWRVGTDSLPQDGSSSQSGALSQSRVSTGQQRSYMRWQDSAVDIMLDMMIELVNQGRQTSNSNFQACDLTDVTRALRAAGYPQETAHVRRKWSELKGIWRDWVGHLEHLSGWGRSHLTDDPENDPQIMRSYFEAHPEYKKFENKPPPHPEQLAKLLGSAGSTGRYNTTAQQAMLDSPSPDQRPDTQDQNDDVFGDDCESSASVISITSITSLPRTPPSQSDQPHLSRIRTSIPRVPVSSSTQRSTSNRRGRGSSSSRSRYRSRSTTRSMTDAEPVMARLFNIVEKTATSIQKTATSLEKIETYFEKSKSVAVSAHLRQKFSEVPKVAGMRLPRLDENALLYKCITVWPLADLEHEAEKFPETFSGFIDDLLNRIETGSVPQMR